jgi:hypothetical protein
VRPQATISLGDALEHYTAWPAPHVIVSDGAYGVGGFPGDPPTAAELPAWYEPHIEAWTRAARTSTTLWFWGTELGWATVHPLLVARGWEYGRLSIWDKGLAHIAGNVHTAKLRGFPPVTEVCAQYTRPVVTDARAGVLHVRDWLRGEWARCGLTLDDANRACGVADAAGRKYLNAGDWYWPPPAAFEALVRAANERGAIAGRPYFALTGARPVTGEEYVALRPVFRCPIGVTNVWRVGAVRGQERRRADDGAAVHANQKPLELIERLVEASSNPGNVVWEPFGGLCPVAVVGQKLWRRTYSAEIDGSFIEEARRRLAEPQQVGFDFVANDQDE